jgi:hypothetical protein
MSRRAQARISGMRILEEACECLGDAAARAAARRNEAAQECDQPNSAKRSTITVESAVSWRALSRCFRMADQQDTIRKPFAVTHDLNSREPHICGLRVIRQLVAETRLIPGARRSVTRQEQSQLVLKNALFRRGFGLYNQMLAAKVTRSCNYTCMGSQSQASQTNRIKADNHIYVAHKR